MTDIPRAVLSEHFQERMEKRRLVSAIFTTFTFEPAFFETEVLPVFFDVGLSHAPAIRLLQLEDALRSLGGSVAVYYDRNGLVADGGAAKLDVRRIPIAHRTGIFHPKNVMALVEAAEPDEHGRRPRTLVSACLSANLTRSGWWENVEVAHVEEIAEGEHTNLRDALLDYLDRLVAAAEGRRPNDDLRRQHPAVNDIREHLRRTTQRDHRSVEGRLLTHFHDGRASVPEFLHAAAGRALRGMCLEVISPYFDGDGESAPLQALIDAFEPREIRVFLPRNDRGEAECPEELFSWVRALPNTSWGALPTDLLRLGKAEDVKHRRVHAKVYRFFDPVRDGRELLYVGSANLTRPGFRIAGDGGNWETGYVVEMTTGARPRWWLAADTREPPSYAPKEETEGAAASGGTRLMLRYSWDRHEATAFWNDDDASPALGVEHGGVRVIDVASLGPRRWQSLGATQSQALERSLISTSIFCVVGDGPEPGLLLVQEEGMHARPSLLHELSAAEILRYWSLLTIEQRAAFIEARVRISGDDDPLVAKLAPLVEETTLFDRFAGVFHAFECLEQRVREALDEGHHREADYRLFGRKYDSLGSLVARVVDEVAASKGDRVEQYVVMLCTRQLLREIGRAYPEYWAEHRADVRGLEGQIAGASTLRAALAARDGEMPAFLDWFEKWFLRRAEPLSEGEGV